MESVKEMNSMMSFSRELVDFSVSNEGEWASFGKMDSHAYRKKLLRIFRGRKMTAEEMLVVYMCASISKNKAQIERSLEHLKEEVKKKPWFRPVLRFFKEETTHCVAQATRLRKFPVVNIPCTHPGLDIMLYLGGVPTTEWIVVNLARRTTFSQLSLNNDLQSIAEAGYKYYWDNMVGTRNPDRPDRPKFRADFYENTKKDSYKLLLPNWTQFLDNSPRPYDYFDLITYLALAARMNGRVYNYPSDLDKESVDKIVKFVEEFEV